MNIIELAKQAGYETDMFGVGHWDSEEFQKFSRLIIKECGRLADSSDQHNIKPSDRINKFFGMD